MLPLVPGPLATAPLASAVLGVLHNVSMSQFLQFPVRDWEDWRRFKEERLGPDHPGRLSGDWREQCAAWMERGYPIQLGYFRM
ncbi:MAG: hypothetical protein QME94_18360 [Anaerolineae bacterium]|nr:hypothetical protein [Anaerolineae bacterium]